MRTEQLEARPLFQPLHEVRFEIHGMKIDVSYSMERMKSDFISFGILRGLDELLLRQTAQNLIFKEKTIQESADGIMEESGAKAIPSENSIFMVRYNYNKIKKEIEEEVSSGENINNPDYISQVAKNVFERDWRHEREHLYQEFEQPTEDDFNKDDLHNKHERINKIGALAWGITAKYTFLSYYHLLQLNLSGAEEILSDGIGIGIFYLIRKAKEMEDVFNSTSEIKAREEEKDGLNLPGIFDVKVSTF